MRLLVLDCRTLLARLEIVGITAAAVSRQALFIMQPVMAIRLTPAPLLLAAYTGLTQVGHPLFTAQATLSSLLLLR